MQDSLVLDDKLINNLFWSQSIPYNYYLPKILHLGFRDLKLRYMSNIGYFNNFFRGLNTLHCDNCLSLSLVPCEICFDINLNLHQNKNKRDEIETFNWY